MPGSPRNVVILGSTGSIGTQTLDVAARLGPERVRIIGLVARRNVELLAQQARDTQARYIATTEDALGPELEEALKGSGAGAVGWGEGTMVDLAVAEMVDTVVVAVSGAAALRATLAACEAGKRVCIATKEVLVAAGELVVNAARGSGAEIIPIDSEHSAIFQCLRGYKPEDIEHIYLTASGGPFRTWTPEQMEQASVEDALKHPTWRMGGKITIDSATLMNKGLEIIEAAWLFGVPVEKVSVVVHPQSVVHSFVEMKDGALLAQLGLPDMRLPIQIALTHPEKVDTGMPRLSPTQMGPLTFEEPDTERFPSLELARRAARIGGTMPAVLNAANEAAVAAFLDKKIGFTDITRLVDRAMNAHRLYDADSLEKVLAADAEARQAVASFIDGSSHDTGA